MHPLEAYRRRNRLSQAALAERLAVSRETIARWESGVRKIKADRLLAVAQATGLSTDQLRPDLASLMRGAQ